MKYLFSASVIKKKLQNRFLSFNDFTELLLLCCNNSIAVPPLQKTKEQRKYLASLILLIKIFISYYT